MRKHPLTVLWHFAILLAILAHTPSVRADLLDDITSGRFKPEKPAATIPLADGERYAALDGGMLFAYSYKTGEITDTLFAAEKVKGDATALLQRLGKPEGALLSEDNRYVLLYSGKKQIFRHSFEADWFLFDTRRRELRPLSPGMPLRDPVFSPDGKYIAFVRNNDLFIHKVDYNTEVAVTTNGKPDTLYNGAADWLYEEEFGITALYTFSRDSKQLAFVRLDDSEVPEYSWQEYLSDDGKPLRLPVVRKLRYPKTGDNNPKAVLYLYDTYYKSVTAITLPVAKDSYIPRIKWTNATDKQPAGELAVETLNRDQNRMEVFVVNPKSHMPRTLYSEERKDGWVEYSLFDSWLWLQDNSFIALSEKDGYAHAYLYGQQGNERALLTKDKYDVTALYGFDEAAQTLFYQAAGTSPLRREVYALNTKKNTVTCLTPDDGMHSAQFSQGMRYFIDNYRSAAIPDRWSVVDRKGALLRVMKDNNAVAEAAKATGLPQKEFFSFVTSRGDTLNGWMLRPKTGAKPLVNRNAGAKGNPLLLMQYSGPASQMVLDRWRIDWEEYLAAERGVLCVCIDPRGTGARGKAFRSGTYMNLGQLEAEDLIEAAAYLVREGLADPDHMTIWGWSYGGYQALRTLLEPECPFRCGIAVAPVTDWGLYDSAYTERFMRRPQVNETGYERSCLTSIVEKRAESLNDSDFPRLLIAHGMADDNVHVQHSFLFTEALTEAGLPFDMQVFPDDNHFLRRRADYRQLYRRMLRFLEQNM